MLAIFLSHAHDRQYQPILALFPSEPRCGFKILLYMTLKIDMANFLNFQQSESEAPKRIRSISKDTKQGVGAGT